MAMDNVKGSKRRESENKKKGRKKWWKKGREEKGKERKEIRIKRERNEEGEMDGPSVSPIFISHCQKIYVIELALMNIGKVGLENC